MAASCTISPQVKNKQGEIVDSQLWSDLRKVLPYQKARDAYLTIKGDEFIGRYGNSSKIQYDENGEPTYSSIANLVEFSSIIDIDSRILAERKKIKNSGPKEATRDNIDAADNVAISYNDSKERDKSFVATTSIYTDGDGSEKVRIDIGRYDNNFGSKMREMINKRRLNRKLRAMLESKGIHVDVLSELQQKIRRITGVTDFESSIVAASGMANTIQIARGRKGLDALPEEFSHFVVEALHDSPLIKRLYSLVLDNSLASIILGDNYESYCLAYEQQLKDDEFVGYKKVFADNASRGDTLVEHDELDRMLAYEAIGHLIYERILAAEQVLEPERISTGAEYLIERLKTHFKNTLSDYDVNELYRAINEAQNVAGEFAESIMNGDLYEQVNTENVATTAKFYQLESEVKDKRELLFKLRENLRKRYQILRNSEETFDKKKEAKLIRRIEKNFIQAEYDLGILSWASNSLEQMKVLASQLEMVKVSQDMPMNMRAQILLNIKSYLQSYAVALDSIMYGLREGFFEENPDITTIVDELNEMVAQVNQDYSKLASPMMLEILREFVGDGIEIPYVKIKDKEGNITFGKKYTAEDLLAHAEKDISVLDRWLDAAAESGDWMIRIMDNLAKKYKGESRLDTIAVKKQLQSAYNKLKASGYSDTEFVYEHDASGRVLPQYITIEQAERLSKPQRDYYVTVMNIKRELDALLPDGTTSLLKAPVIRKSYVERLKEAFSNGDVSGAWEKTVESVKDGFLRRADDSDFGGELDGRKDFSGHAIERLPIYFINGGEDMTDLSTDVTSTMLMYAKMANDYHNMSKCVYTLEFMRDNARQRKIYSDALSDNEEAKAVAPTVEEARAGKRMDDWFSSQVYGRYMKDEGTFGDTNIDKGKTANAINQLTALNKFALNILSGLSNVMTGSVMMRIESIAGQWFKMKDVFKADKIFWSQMLKYAGEIGIDNKTSKLALFDELFNVMQDWESEVAGKDMQRSRMGHLMSSNSLYFINNAGELWMQNRTALALAQNYMLKDRDGNEINLWDAYDVKINGAGVGELVLKDGVTKLDGTEFTREDIIKFTNKAKSINQRMHGIYNYEDRSAAQATAIGRLGLMFRKWIKTSMNRRYGYARYNFDLEKTEEGYYRTVGRFIHQVFKDIKDGKMDLQLRFGEMDEYERTNFRRAFAEVGHLLLVGFAFALLKGWGDDDDDEGFNDTWAYQQMEYQAKRLQTEIGAMTPGLRMPKEVLTILKSPAAAVSTAQGTLNFLQLISPIHWLTGQNTKVIESGKYRGHRQAYKLVMDSPFIPFKETIRRGLNPKEQISYYQ